MRGRCQQQQNPGRWTVQKERFGIEDAPASQGHVPRAKRVGDVIPALLKDVGLEDRLWEESLLNEWAKLVGPQVASHARPGRLERKTLQVFVNNSVWLNELVRYSQGQMLNNIQARFGSDRVRSLRIQLDPDPH